MRKPTVTSLRQETLRKEAGDESPVSTPREEAKDKTARIEEDLARTSGKRPFDRRRSKLEVDRDDSAVDAQHANRRLRSGAEERCRLVRRRSSRTHTPQ